MGGRVDVVEIPSIDIHGEGSSTGKLIEVTEQIIKEAKVIYQNVWADFDSDRDKPSEFDPGTMVYQLVEELKRYLDE